MKHDIDLLTHNRQAWDAAVDEGDKWTLPVSAEALTQARTGRPHIVLTPQKAVPQDWLGELQDQKVLCLASGGGQQGPLLAAAGAQVVVYDNSPKQLQQDQKVARSEALELTTEQGDMRDLSRFEDASFDLIVHPVSNCFVDDVHVVWREAYRVLKMGGQLLSGFCHPILFSYDRQLEAQDILQLKYPVPYRADKLSPAELKAEFLDQNKPLEFGHSLSAQIGGQLAAGFVLTGFYEDDWGGRIHDNYMPHFLATRAQKIRLS